MNFPSLHAGIVNPFPSIRFLSLLAGIDREQVKAESFTFFQGHSHADALCRRASCRRALHLFHRQKLPRRCATHNTRASQPPPRPLVLLLILLGMIRDSRANGPSGSLLAYALESSGRLEPFGMGYP
jgi:hypothetical protein